LRRKKLQKSVTALAAVVAGAGTALVATAPAVAAGPKLQLAAGDDAYVSSGRKNGNFGGDDKLAIGRLEGDAKIAFVKFQVPAGTQVTGARLRLVTVGDVAGKVTVNRVADTGWSELKITSANAPALGAVVASATPKTGAELSLDLGAAVTGPGTYSFAIQSSAANAVTRLRAAEGKWGGPLLTVTTRDGQPAPAAPSEPPADHASDDPAVPPATPIEDEDMPPPAVEPTTPAPTTPAPTTPAPTTPATPAPKTQEHA
jgi:hypothetical protein